MMICSTLNQLHQLTIQQPGWISRAQMIRVVCTRCQQSEVCPAVSLSEYEAREDRYLGSVSEIKKDVKD